MTRPFARRAPARRQPEGSGSGPVPESAGESVMAESVPAESVPAESVMTDGLPLAVPPAQVMSRSTAVILAVAGGLTFALLTIWVAERASAVPGVDAHIHRWVIAHRDPASAAVARAVTWGGVTRIVLPALIVVGAVTARAGRNISRRLVSGLLLACVAGAGVLVEIRINALVGRVRPPRADWAGTAGGPSFPSVHTTAATLFALSCAWALAARLPAGWPRRAVWAGAAAYAAAVGWSRVWLGVHWPTDVAGGWLFGLAWSAGSIAVIRTLRQRSARRRAGQPEG